MSYLKTEIINQAREIDLLTYLKQCEPNNLVYLSPGVYCTKEHDSLKISNGKWMWWSRGFGGHNALEYLIKVKEYSFKKSVKILSSINTSTPIESIYVDEQKLKKLRLPKKSTSLDTVIAYLSKRGIDRDIIIYCAKKGLLYENLPYHSAVFIGYDELGIARYAAYRATCDKRIMGDVSGSDKHFSFRIETQADSTVHLFESAIDVLSYATLVKLYGGDWKKKNYLSLAGVYGHPDKIEESKIPVAVVGFLIRHPEIKRIVLHFDNDNVGRLAAKALLYKLSDKYEVVDSPPPFGKDCNDFLCTKLKFFKQKGRNCER